eukprot:209507-Chlamydomonas_euryale.AAC.1
MKPGERGVRESLSDSAIKQIAGRAGRRSRCARGGVGGAHAEARQACVRRRTRCAGAAQQACAARPGCLAVEDGIEDGRLERTGLTGRSGVKVAKAFGCEGCQGVR